MAMDIELRNALGALTGQVQELTKQSKTLDTTLAGALDKGVKSAGGLADGVRKTRHEMSLAEEISTRVGRAWTSQMFAMATGAVGVTAIWQGVQSQVEAVFKRMEERQKSVRDFADKSRPAAPPAMLPALRTAIRKGGLGLSPDQQADSLKKYLEGGGPADADEVRRLGQVVAAAPLLGLDVEDTAGRYGKLRKLGVTNPEDLIYSLAEQQKLGDVDKMKGGEAKSRAGRAQGSWRRALGEARKMAPEDAAAWSQRVEAAKAQQELLDEGLTQTRNSARLERLRRLVGDPLSSAGMTRNKFTRPGPWGIGMSPRDITSIQQRFPGQSLEEIASMLDAQIDKRGAVPFDRLDQLPTAPEQLSTPDAAPAAPIPSAPPAPWGSTVPRRESPQVAPRRVNELTRVVIEGDNRPGFGLQPINAGE